MGSLKPRGNEYFSRDFVKKNVKRATTGWDYYRKKHASCDDKSIKNYLRAGEKSRFSRRIPPCLLSYFLSPWDLHQSFFPLTSDIELVFRTTAITKTIINYLCENSWWDKCQALNFKLKPRRIPISTISFIATQLPLNCHSLPFNFHRINSYQLLN